MTGKKAIKPGVFQRVNSRTGQDALLISGLLMKTQKIFIMPFLLFPLITPALATEASLAPIARVLPSLMEVLLTSGSLDVRETAIQVAS